MGGTGVSMRIHFPRRESYDGDMVWEDGLAEVIVKMPRYAMQVGVPL